MASKISATTDSTKWKKLRQKLQDNIVTDKYWLEAILILEGRVKERYFNPIKVLLDIPSKRGEGFSIVTVQCALIEFLSACRDGKIYKYNYNPNVDPNYYYRSSSAVFKKLLETAPIFKGYFHTPAKYSSQDFYDSVRCALLHEAYTRNGWTINTTPDLKKDKNNKIIIKPFYGKKKIYRTALFNALDIYFISFLDELKQNSIAGQTLRKHLGRKLDQICEIANDGKYWWL